MGTMSTTETERWSMPPVSVFFASIMLDLKPAKAAEIEFTIVREDVEDALGRGLPGFEPKS